MVKYLIDRGADPSKINQLGEAPAQLDIVARVLQDPQRAPCVWEYFEGQSFNLAEGRTSPWIAFSTFDGGLLSDALGKQLTTVELASGRGSSFYQIVQSSPSCRGASISFLYYFTRI